MKISVITPNYNYARFLDRMIESSLGQDYQNFEHIIVDDGSKDDSVEIITKHTLRHPGKIRLITQSNQGQSAALNKALENCTGDVICWLNSDDAFAPGAFNKIRSAFAADKNMDAVFGDIVIINERDEEIKKVKYLPFNYLSGIFNGFGKVIPSNAIYWKRELTFKPTHTEWFVNTLHYAMDSEYWSRILLNKKVVHIKEILACFRYHSSAKTIKRQVKNSEASINSQKEDLLVKNNSLRYRKLHNIPFNSFLYLFFKTKRHFSKLMAGHYFG